MKTVAIIGAGMAGLAAAQALTRRGFHATIYEKSAGVGGRVATRRVHGCVCDHGAQVIYTPTPELLQLAQAGPGVCDIGRPVWLFAAAGTVREGDPKLNAAPKWCWPGGATMLGKTLAAGLQIQHQVHVQRLTATPEGYTLYDTTGHALGTVDAVLLTPPAPQTAELIAASTLDQQVQKELLHELSDITYRRCLSVALAYPRRPEVPWYALVNTDRAHPVSWLACEHDKPGHAPPDIGLMIAQMANSFSLEHWDAVEKRTYDAAGTPLPSSLMQVHQYVQTLAGDLGTPLWADLHRWRYSLPDYGKSADFATLNGSGCGLYFAGDYIEGRGRVFEVIECGWRVAEQIGSDMG